MIGGEVMLCSCCNKENSEYNGYFNEFNRFVCKSCLFKYYSDLYVACVICKNQIYNIDNAYQTKEGHYLCKEHYESIYGIQEEY